MPVTDDSAGVRRILVTGASGYVGGRLVPELLGAGFEVRCLARSPAKLEGRSWSDRVEVVPGDVNDRAAVVEAMGDVDAAYYLVHSMGATAEFAERDRAGAGDVPGRGGECRGRHSSCTWVGSGVTTPSCRST